MVRCWRCTPRPGKRPGTRCSARPPRKPALGCCGKCRTRPAATTPRSTPIRGEEGKFYLWTPDQVRELLSTEEYVAFAVCHGLEQPPNFRESLGIYSGSPSRPIRQPLGGRAGQVGEWLAAARRKLLEARSPQRIWPGRDEKILTAWNGLTIRGMAIFGHHLGQTEFVASAERALDFIRARLWRDGRLLAVYKDGQARLNAYLDDYAFLIDGILELLQCRWRDGDLISRWPWPRCRFDHPRTGKRADSFSPPLTTRP
ncbi:MAG: hypothetical protein R3F44_01495 [Candidatus Competibacteraceae bacterium]